MICIAGKNEIAVFALQWLLKKGVPITSIVACTNKTDNGEHGWQPSYKKICERLGVKIVSLDELYSIDNLLFISLEYDRLIKPGKFSTKRLFNIHFSNLPAYKGMYTSIWPLVNAESKGGVTLHYIDRGIDTGDIIDHVEFDIPLHFNGLDLYKSYLRHSAVLFEKNIQALLDENFTSFPQEAKGASYYSKATIDFKNLAIDYNKTAWEIQNQIRAFAFRVYQLPKFNGQEITHAVATNEKSLEKPGILLKETETFFLIASVDYNVCIYKDALQKILDAATAGNLTLLKELKQHGHNLTEKNTKGWDALIVAAYNEQAEVCKWLLQNGADVNSVNNNGTSVLMYSMTAACKSNRTDVMDLLLQNGASKEQEDYEGISLLQYAKKYGNNHVIEYLENNDKKIVQQ